MGLSGIQAVMDAAKALLLAEMPAETAALNAEYDDRYAIAEPDEASYFDHALNPLTLACDWPAIILLDGGRVRDDAESNFALHVFRYALGIDILVRGSDAVEMTQKLRRYERAVVEILSVRHALAPACTNCTFDQSSGGEFTDPNSGDLLQDRICRFIVTTAEALP